MKQNLTPSEIKKILSEKLSTHEDNIKFIFEKQIVKNGWLDGVCQYNEVDVFAGAKVNEKTNL